MRRKHIRTSIINTHIELIKVEVELTRAGGRGVK